MSVTNNIRVFLIDDDEDDYIITEDSLLDSTHYKFDLTWTPDPSVGLQEILDESYDIYLIDLHLGEYSGMELLQEAIEKGCTKPLILLTGNDNVAVDLKALELGASDYLIKGQFDSQLLERAILYAIRHKQTLNELKLSESRYRGLIENQTELICRFTTDTTLTFVNNAYANYFGSTIDDLINTPWIRLVSDSRKESTLDFIQSVARNRIPVTYEVQVFDDNGEYTWQQWTDRPIIDEAGNVIEIQSIGMDITQRKQSEEALKSALEHERELGELKSRFISMASHEFRTPLTTILSTASFLKMAEERLTSEKRIVRLTKIEDAAHDMTQLLDDVLVFGKAEANRLEFNPKDGNLVEFCAEIVEDIQASIGKYHLFDFDSSMSSPIILLDSKLMRQIITNLITNAVKYSPEGSTISIKLEDDSEHFIVTVSDEGIGIPEADQQHLFKPFHRARNTGEIQGTGLGLAITQKAIELHGGSITFKSETNIGTCFKLMFPYILQENESND